MSFIDEFKLQSQKVSVLNFKTSKETYSNIINAVLDVILSGKKSALAEMNYLDEYTDLYEEFEEDNDISLYSDRKIQRINSNVFIVPCKSETSSFNELTRIY